MINILIFIGRRSDLINLKKYNNNCLFLNNYTRFFGPSYRTTAITSSNAVAAMAEDRKAIKYNHLTIHYVFMPVAIESLGALGPVSISFFKSLGHRIRTYPGDKDATIHLLQRLSIAFQRGNASIIMDTLPPSLSF